MVLNYDEITTLCANPSPLISDYKPNAENPAKVDLRLGMRCYCSSQPQKIYHLTDGCSVEIPPNEIFLFQTLESVNMPNHLVGHLSLKMGLVRKGLLMPSQTQIDPGYNNYLFGMFYNLSTDTIKLAYGDDIVTVEFSSTTPASSTYAGAMDKITFEQFLSNRISCSLGNLHQSISKVEYQANKATKRLSRSTTTWNIIITCLSVFLTVLSIIIAFSNSDAKNQIRTLEEQIVIQKEQITNLEEQVDSFEVQISNQGSLLDTYQQHFNDTLQNRDIPPSNISPPSP